MQAILTKYHGPTNHRGARITARSASGLSATVPYAHELEPDQAHRKAADALCIKLGWHHEWLVAGSLMHGYAFVFAPPRDIAGNMRLDDLYAARGMAKNMERSAE